MHLFLSTVPLLVLLGYPLLAPRHHVGDELLELLGEREHHGLRAQRGLASVNGLAGRAGEERVRRTMPSDSLADSLSPARSISFSSSATSPSSTSRSSVGGSSGYVGV